MKLQVVLSLLAVAVIFVTAEEAAETSVSSKVEEAPKPVASTKSEVTAAQESTKEIKKVLRKRRLLVRLRTTTDSPPEEKNNFKRSSVGPAIVSVSPTPVAIVSAAPVVADIVKTVTPVAVAAVSVTPAPFTRSRARAATPATVAIKATPAPVPATLSPYVTPQFSEFNIRSLEKAVDIRPVSVSPQLSALERIKIEDKLKAQEPLKSDYTVALFDLPYSFTASYDNIDFGVKTHGKTGYAYKNNYDHSGLGYGVISNSYFDFSIPGVPGPEDFHHGDVVFEPAPYW